MFFLNSWLRANLNRKNDTICVWARLFLAKKIRQLYARQISSSSFDDEVVSFFIEHGGTIRDIAVFRIFEVIWTLYSDFSDTDMTYLAKTKRTKKMIARTILFLHSNLAYDEKNFSVNRICFFCWCIFKSPKVWIYKKRCVFWPYSPDQYKKISSKRKIKYYFK